MLKRIIICSFLLMAGLFQPYLGLAAGKPMLAVMDFSTNGVPDAMRGVLSQGLRENLAALDRYQVSSIDELRSAANKSAVPATDCDTNDQACLMALGTELDIQMLVAGSVSKIGRYYFVSLRLLDVQGDDAGLRHRVSERCDCNQMQLEQTISDLTDRLLTETRIAQPLPPLPPLPPPRRPSPPVLPKDEPVLLQADQPIGGDIWTEPLTGIEFVWIPPGCVELGSPDTEKGRDQNEGPRQRTCVEGFWMGRYEITNAQFRQFRDGHSSRSYEKTSLNKAGQPVVYISWEDAVAFAKWLSNEAQIRFRLPTEAQWEYAARAGTETPYFWGADANQACAYANVADKTAKRRWPEWTVLECEDGMTVSAPVGGFAPNPFGLYDMLGNVWEWCRDRYRKTLGASSGDGGNLQISDKRVYRGGSWNVRSSHLRAARRVPGIPTVRSYNLGFRLVREN